MYSRVTLTRVDPVTHVRSSRTSNQSFATAPAANNRLETQPGLFQVAGEAQASDVRMASATSSAFPATEQVVDGQIDNPIPKNFQQPSTETLTGDAIRLSAAQSGSPTTRSDSPTTQPDLPDVQSTSPNAQSTSPTAQSTSPTAHPVSPAAQSTSPAAQSVSPVAHFSDSPARSLTVSPVAQSASPAAQPVSPAAQFSSLSSAIFAGRSSSTDASLDAAESKDDSPLDPVDATILQAKHDRKTAPISEQSSPVATKLPLQQIPAKSQTATSEPVFSSDEGDSIPNPTRARSDAEFTPTDGQPSLFNESNSDAVANTRGRILSRKLATTI